MNPAVVGELVYVGSCSGTFYAFDAESGDVVWEFDTARFDEVPASFHGAPAVVDNLIITGSDSPSGGSVYAFELTRGELVWELPVGGLPTDLQVLDDVVIGGTSDGELVAIEVADGSMAWSFVPPAGERGRLFTQPPAIVDGTIYYGNSAGTIHALDDAGTVLREWQVDGRPSTPIRSIGPHLYIGTNANAVFRMDHHGEIIEMAETTNSPHHSLVPIGDAVAVLVGESVLSVYSTDLTEVRWSLPTKEKWTSHNPIVYDGALLIGDSAGVLHALNVTDGKVLWTHALEGALRGIGAGAGRLYVGSLQGDVFAVTPPSGP